MLFLDGFFLSMGSLKQSTNSEVIIGGKFTTIDKSYVCIFGNIKEIK